MEIVLEQIKSKIVSAEVLVRKIETFRLKSDRIVFTDGCFDLLHLGHVTYLAKAASLGNRLIVAVNSDASVQTLEKGILRPLQDQESRAMIMASLAVVDLVIVFDEPTPLNIIKLVNPDVLVKGGDWQPETIVGYDEVRKNGGQVLSIPLEPGYSTSAIEKKIADFYKL